MYKVIEERKEPFKEWETIQTVSFDTRQDAISYTKKRYNELYSWIQEQGYRHEGDISEDIYEEDGEFYAYTDIGGPEFSLTIEEND